MVAIPLAALVETGLDAIATQEPCLVTELVPPVLRVACGTETRTTPWPPRSSDEVATFLSDVLRIVDRGRTVRAERVRALARALARTAKDPFTAYIPPDLVAAITSHHAAMVAASPGIDVWPREPTRVRAVRARSSAALRGIAAGERIVAIDGTAAEDLSFAEVSALLHGAAASEVRVKVRGATGERVLELTRALLPERDVLVQRLPHGVVYVMLSAFAEGSASRIASTLADGQAAAVILDLRHNGGGYVPEGIALADLFLATGPIAGVRGRPGRPTEDFVAHPSDRDVKVPLVVLVDGQSASASELVALALQQHRRALVLGAQTAGKGTVQRQIHMPDGGVLKVTAGSYVGPSGAPLDERGVLPDRVLPASPTPTVQEGASPLADSWVLTALDVLQELLPGRTATSTSRRGGPAP